MFKEIESKFKDQEGLKRNRITIICLFITYFLMCFLMIKYIENNCFLIIIPVSIFFFLLYFCVVRSNNKDRLCVDKKWYYIFYISDNIRKFKINQRKKDKYILITIFKENHINTRHKVGKILDHYRSLIPRNINEKTSIISILAFLSVYYHLHILQI